MPKLFSFVFVLFITQLSFSQAKVDLDRSVPLWMDYNPSTGDATLRWINDDDASIYYVSKVDEFQNLELIESLDGFVNEFHLGTLIKGIPYPYHIRKGLTGRGIITVGLELPAIHQRGRCLLAIDSKLSDPLQAEIAQTIDDIEMDGWIVDTLHIDAGEAVTDVKSKITDWYIPSYEMDQMLYLLGHIPVPYSGNSAHDGHSNHQGAWAADLFYGDMDGNWTDVFVDNTSPAREKNKNIPGDGKYDNTANPSNIELQIGRVDFNDLPAFELDEIELTRNYLNKSHAFKMGQNDYPRRALVENNFSGFAEGFGQSAWRNFPTLFGGDSVSIQNYEVVLENDKYLFSYACGGGSYTSCNGVGTTQNLWASKDIQTIFTFTFGSYFGDWDSQNNFLRSALGSGDVLVNAWAGRPTWQVYEMALGKTIGYCTQKTQDAGGSFYNQGNSSKSAHIALMGDPTLRLHAVRPPEEVSIDQIEGDIHVSWTESIDATHGYMVYRSINEAPFELMYEKLQAASLLDTCFQANSTYRYMVKSIKLEQTGSGSYYNTSLGKSIQITTDTNDFIMAYYLDEDMDGFGAGEIQFSACSANEGYSSNDLDCDDTNADINPNGTEIINNGIDEDCDGEDFTVNSIETKIEGLALYPNPSPNRIHIKNSLNLPLNYSLYSMKGIKIESGKLGTYLDIEELPTGLYQIKISNTVNGRNEFQFYTIQKI
ncbi:MAG: MopE-related protein [Saprospiraceae bacterium]|nr:MopE-related protein [Saprospiraceae bacterium]